MLQINNYLSYLDVNLALFLRISLCAPHLTTRRGPHDSLRFARHHPGRRPAGTGPVSRHHAADRARENLRQPEQVRRQLSPDGKWLSWIAPRDGVLNVWVAPASDPSQAKPLTEPKNPDRSAPASGRPIPRSLMFMKDKGGDENFLLYGVDVASGKQTNYTPFEKPA
jgi:hypothetical protein